MKKTIKNKNYLAMALCFLCMLFSACEDSFNDSGFVTEVPVNIGSFIINGIGSEIDDRQGKITSQLPYGSDLTAIVPQLTIPEKATVSPANGEQVDFTDLVRYRVENGNIYKEYQVTISTERPIQGFSIDGVEANINHNSKTIALVLPEGTDVTQLQPIIELGNGVSISPLSGSILDFTDPVSFTVSGNGTSEDYTAMVSIPGSGPAVAFLGIASSRQGISNPDERVASDWLFENYPTATYLSFTDIANGTSLAGIDVIWWHHDAAIELPNISMEADVIAALQTYRANGGNLLLTAFASQYVEPLGIVPSGKGPNNVFGDFPPNGFVDDNNDWGMSFVGHEDHPVFQGLETYAPGKANLLEKGTFRLNHTAWWFLPEWGGYENGQGWRDQTGGNNLASEAWDDSLDGRVTIAEFPDGEAPTDIDTVVISMGAYDWYNENDANDDPSQANGFIDNIRTLTANSIDHLTEN